MNGSAKKNVLVFPCGSEIGLEVFRSLSYSTHFNLFGGSSVDDHGKFVYQNYVGDMPLVDDPEFIERLNSVIKKYKIDFVIPTHDSVVLKLAKAKTQKKLNCEIITSPLETCEITRSKAKTYKTLAGVVKTPKVFSTVDRVDESQLPIFVKPDVGQGSKGTQLANTIEELKFYLAQNPSLLATEYLPGKEYTVDCFTNSAGELIFCEGRERKRTQNGISVNTFSVTDERFGDIARKINDKLVLRGAWFFQVKENVTGELVLMEVAPRVAGTMALVRCKGVNLVLLSLFDAMGHPTEIIENNYELVLDRALGNTYRHNINYGHVYLDFDDLVIFEGKVNPAVMAFVFQCLNKGISIHLLTKHRQNLEESLQKYKLNGLFDELIWLKDNEEKYAYIKEKDAIFIDDSFTERSKVYNSKQIPVFDSHMIEALMEKF